MASIQPTGRPSLSNTNPVGDEAEGSSGTETDTENYGDDEDSKQKEFQEGVQRKSTALIQSANLGYINWRVKDKLEHGYYNKRSIDDPKVRELRADMEHSDHRVQHPLYAAVNKGSLEACQIKPSKGIADAPTLTAEQVESLSITGIAGQHRLAAAEGILKDKEARLGGHRAVLSRLEKEFESGEVAEDEEPKGGAPVAEASAEAGDKPSEGSGGAADGVGGGIGPRVWGVKDLPELRELVKSEEDGVNFCSFWPVVLMDQAILPSDSDDLVVLTALVALSSNKAVQQNTGTAYESWLLVRPLLSIETATMDQRVRLALGTISKSTVELIKFGPIRRLLYTFLDIPELRSEFQPGKWKRVLKSPAATFIILVLQGSLNNLLKVFNPEDITQTILSTLDAAYEGSIQASWKAVTCDLDSSSSDGSLPKYAAAVKARLQAYKANNVGDEGFTVGKRNAVDKAQKVVEDVVLKSKVPLFSPSFMVDSLDHLGKVSEAFIWAERYFSPDAALFGSYTKAKGKNKRPDAAFAVINEILNVNAEWREGLESYDIIIPKLVPIILNHGRTASAVITQHMTTKKPQMLPSVDSRVYGLFATKLAKAKDSSNTKTARKTDTSGKKWSEEEVQDQLQGVTEVITALSTVNGIQRLGQILDAKRNSKSRIDLATHLIHFIWTCRNENAEILKYAAVVQLMKGIMEIGVDRDDTPCLIAGKVPAVDAEGLQDFKVSSVDASLWENVEGPLKIAGVSISKALALLPQHKVTAPVQKWQQLIEEIRDIYGSAYEEGSVVEGNVVPANPYGNLDYIQRKKVAGAPPVPWASPLKTKKRATQKETGSESESEENTLDHKKHTTRSKNGDDGEYKARNDVGPGPSRRPSTKDKGKAKEVQKEPVKKVVKVGPAKGPRKRKNEELEDADDDEEDKGGKKKGRTAK